MQINYNLASALFEIHQKEKIYEDQSKLPLVAQKIIELGKEKGVNINIRYGTFTKDYATIAGYWITAVDFGKHFFKQDIYIEDESDENLKAALDFMNTQINYLKN